MSPSPSTRVPLVQIATVRPIIVKREASATSLVDRRADAGDPGRVDVAHVLQRLQRLDRADLELAALVRVQGAVVEGDHAHALERLDVLGDGRRAWLRSWTSTEISRTERSRPIVIVTMSPISAVGVGDRVADLGELAADVRLVDAEDVVECHGGEVGGGVCVPRRRGRRREAA